MRFGVCTSIDQAARRAAIGFDYVEVHAGSLAAMDESGFSAFCRENAAAPIHAEAANCLFPGEMRLVGPDVAWELLEAYIDKALHRLSLAGITGVCFGSGGCRKYPEGFSPEEAWQQMVRVGRILGQTGGKYGVTVSLEPLCPKETNMVNTMAEGRRLVEEVDHPNFRLLCDLYHVVQNGDRPEDAAVAGAHLAHIHMAKPDDRRTMYPGDGWDYGAFFRALRSVGYDGRISFEGTCSDYDGELPAVLAVMKQSLEV